MLNYNYAQGKVNFVFKDKWEKFSFFDKVKHNFKFSDLNQMPNRGLWRKFNDNEKEDFLTARNAFRSKIILEIVLIKLKQCLL